MRVISGKKGGKGDDEGKVTRRCICCDAKLMVPRDLEKYRCQSCFTVVDLRPLVEQREEREKAKAKQKDGFANGIVPPSARIVPLNVDRTRAIINKCVVAYLESRCRKQEQPQLLPQPQPNKPSLRAEELSTSPEKNIDLLSYMRTDAPPPQQRPATAHGPGPPPPVVQRRPLPAKPTRKPPPPPVDPVKRTPSQNLYPNGSTTPNGMPSPRMPHSPRPTAPDYKARERYDRVKTIFKPLEEYMNASFGDYQSLNTSFSTIRPAHPGRARSESSIKTPPPELADGVQPGNLSGLSELDAKTLLLGDLGENSSWWTGKLDRIRSDKVNRKKVGERSRKAVTSRSPNIDWSELGRWYDVVHTAGHDWQDKIEFINANDPSLAISNIQGPINVEDIEEDLAEAREHAIRALLKITENILKRPSRLLTEPEHIRFLLIILDNPSLYPSMTKLSGISSDAPVLRSARTLSGQRDGVSASPKHISPRKSPGKAREGAVHTGILKRVFGLLAHSSDLCHRYLTGWFARYDQDRFERLVDLVASFVTHRISRVSGRPRSKSVINDGGLIPDLSGSAASTSAQLHSAMGLGGSVKKRDDEVESETGWAADWQTKAAAKLMSILFAANNIWQGRRREQIQTPRVDSGIVFDGSAAPPPQVKAARSGQLMHTSQFYNTLLDYHDLIADFKVWESKREKFAFCQYPLFLSMGTKIKILEYDAHRQMHLKAREAWFDSVIRQSSLDSYFHLRVRRDCMVEDSLRQISEAVGAGQEELKKGLRVHFTGEEGVDAGGPRKEWFLMLVRDIFDPNHGMFVYDEDSRTCYFNPHSFETSDQYYLVGALLGLAIYNSTILDVALPPFAFRKLLASAPSSPTASANISSVTGTKGQMTYTVADLAEFQPSLAAGLQQLLDFEGDVQETYCRNFVISVDRYGQTADIPLIPNGEGTPVTNANRHDFVNAYIRYLLDTSVTRQFEPFKRGFFTVCAGNALSLFRAEEIELLIRGSDECLNVDSLRAVAVYENWKHPEAPHGPIANPADTVSVIKWFWELFAEASPERQRRLLTFITGSDRIPAVGATSLILRLVAGGDGWGGGGKQERERFPVARTCFNMLVLWWYEDKSVLERKLWMAVEESEGFGLK
ncbi:hypothetical protein M433DRAFT_89969 [Acidomyces richmondensis BFW]|nr:MAG: hypothetical protein FE78DRAFT_187225 [Acidomyces sp. 'richmondensis']KYG45202.1 hypothetical protein M433DRAFT_89969 [Acidomyces richmondensis BFW]